MSKLDSLFTAALEQAAQRQVRRRLRHAAATPPGRLALDGRTLVNFSSNDYLGLARHPLLAERASLWATRHGAGAQASRLVCGNLDLHEQVEAKLARLKGTEAALLLASGWQANAAVLPALFKAAAAQGEPQVYTDRLNHASLHHGCQAAGVRQIRFRHNDLAHLEHLLAERAGAPGARFIVTESVFSMDGDRADVPALAALAARHHAFLYLDEAHATGVLGPRGMGLAGLAPGGVDLAMGTFSKGLGSFGAYVAGSRALCDYLVTRLDQARATLQGHGERLRASLAAQGIDCG
ncbi:aminotransferase class I/II-fold pyridoxal phosphate-dependent enzyme, partial [Bordetella pertussis]|uniref:aminotransferase class I/II-fold pyridoxal phosphate-dependent enzyme n=1 Tax=Bordetella pertussis TaxID=520 RepID=UPI000680AB67